MNKRYNDGQAFTAFIRNNLFSDLKERKNDSMSEISKFETTNPVYCIGDCEEDALKAFEKNDIYFDEAHIAERIIELAEEDYQHALTDQYDKVLNELYPAYTIGNLTIMPSDILQNCDPIAYHCDYFNWRDSVCIDLRDEISQMDVNTSATFYGQTIYCYYNDEYEDKE